MRPPRLRCPAVNEPLAELAAYFRSKSPVPDEDLVRLTAAARAGGSRWADIAGACGVHTSKDITGIVSPAVWHTSDPGSELLFASTQYSLHKLTGSKGYFPPLHWDCPSCAQQVTDRAADGRPVHVELGHAPGCTRLAKAQAADDERRRTGLPHLIVNSEPAIGQLQRHWLRERIQDDCPRCGWRGYFHHYIATIGGDWSTAVCDNCYADLHPDITVGLKFYSVRIPRWARSGGGQAFAVIRQRDRSDHDYPDVGHFPDIGQQMTWRLWWEHTTKLVEEAHGGCDDDLEEVSRDEAEQIAADLAARCWPAEAARLPWVAAAYPA
jgi:hypothetical protein